MSRYQSHSPSVTPKLLNSLLSVHVHGPHGLCLETRLLHLALWPLYVRSIDLFAGTSHTSHTFTVSEQCSIWIIYVQITTWYIDSSDDLIFMSCCIRIKTHLERP